MNFEPTREDPIIPGSYTLKIRHQHFDFFASRTLFWREQKTLMAADLHWGKTEIFNRHGVPVPRGILRDDLTRLKHSLEITKAQRLLVLGDLIHGAKGLTQEVIEEVSEWRESLDVYFHLIRGNHDRNLEAPLSWRIDEQSTLLEEEGFLFTHDPVKDNKLYIFGGHLHPMARLNSRGDSLRLPCFVVRSDRTELPAFSFFTGGVDVSPQPGTQLLVIAEDQIIKI